MMSAATIGRGLKAWSRERNPPPPVQQSRDALLKEVLVDQERLRAQFDARCALSREPNGAEDYDSDRQADRKIVP